jgi:hypothetical protein
MNIEEEKKSIGVKQSDFNNMLNELRDINLANYEAVSKLKAIANFTKTIETNEKVSVEIHLDDDTKISLFNQFNSEINKTRKDNNQLLQIVKHLEEVIGFC